MSGICEGRVAIVTGAERLVDQAVEAFGRLDALVSNAGILRDRMIVNTTETEWDAVIRVIAPGARWDPAELGEIVPELLARADQAAGGGQTT